MVEVLDPSGHDDIAELLSLVGAQAVADAGEDHVVGTAVPDGIARRDEHPGRARDPLLTRLHQHELRTGDRAQGIDRPHPGLVRDRLPAYVLADRAEHGVAFAGCDDEDQNPGHLRHAGDGLVVRRIGLPVARDLPAGGDERDGDEGYRGHAHQPAQYDGLGGTRRQPGRVGK